MGGARGENLPGQKWWGEWLFQKGGAQRFQSFLGTWAGRIKNNNRKSNFKKHTEDL